MSNFGRFLASCVRINGTPIEFFTLAEEIFALSERLVDRKSLFFSVNTLKLHVPTAINLSTSWPSTQISGELDEILSLILGTRNVK